MSRKLEQAEHELPFLRQYARAVTGHQSAGDTLVDAALKSVLENASAGSERLELFGALDARLQAWPGDVQHNEAVRLASDSRRALLLTALEGFAPDEAATIMRKGEAEITALVAAADRIRIPEGRRIFIMEDESLVAAHISQIVQDLGHTVIGTAASGEAAVAACQTSPPDLILADIMLTDGATGAMAAEEIAKQHAVPVIFITAYPHRLLQGRNGEPAYLIQKPFLPGTVKALIGQALLQQGYVEP